MSINQVILETLAPLGLPVAPDVYEGDRDSYLVFNYNERGGLFGDNTAQAVAYAVQVHLYLPKGINPLALKRRVCHLLDGADFTWPEVVNASDLEGQHYTFECEYVGAVESG